MAGSVARLRAGPSATAKVVHRLRIGTEVEVIAAQKSGGKLFKKVRTAYRGEEGWLSASLLSSARPTLKALLARADKARSPARARKWLERATALAPGDTKVIERLLANYRALGRKKAAYGVDKGLIAAERRVLSWDGPLYPIVDGVALFPRAPFAGITASTRAAARVERDRKTLRGRAFPLVNSGKVVALTEVGYRTRHLDAPLRVESGCGAGPQAGFALQQPSKRGALVPSWLVAGFRVFAFAPLSADQVNKAYPSGERQPDKEAADGSDAHRAEAEGTEADEAEKGAAASTAVFVDERQQLRVTRRGPAQVKIEVRTLDAPLTLFEGALAHEGATPIVQFAEHERHWLVLFSAPGTRACCMGDEVVMWLERFTLDDRGQVSREVGRAYHSGFAPDCAQETFDDLEGEPRCERLPEGCELGDPKL